MRQSQPCSTEFLVREILRKERQRKETEIYKKVSETCERILKFYNARRMIKMVSEYQKVKALGPLATAAEIQRLEARVDELSDSLKEIQEALAYLQKDTAQPKKND